MEEAESGRQEEKQRAAENRAYRDGSAKLG